MSPELHDFGQWLLADKGFSGLRVSYAIKWVQTYMDGYHDPQADRQACLKKFLGHVDRTQADYMVGYANDALQLYWYWFDHKRKRDKVEEAGEAKAGKTGEDAGYTDWIEQCRAWMGATRDLLRVKHRSLRTEKAYLGWLHRFLAYVYKERQAIGTGGMTLESSQIRSYLTYLAIDRRVSAATQEQAFNALLFFFRNILNQDVEGLQTVLRARRTMRLPEVFSRKEVAAVIEQLDMPYRLAAMLMYGAGLRLEEVLCLRVKDLDFAGESLVVHGGKGDKDRVGLFPKALHPAMDAHLAGLKLQWQKDRLRDLPGVALPGSLGNKYTEFSRDWGWYWLFPARSACLDQRSGKQVLWHVHASVLQKRVHDAVRAAGILRHASCHTFRHSFATHLLEDGYDVSAP